MSRNQIEEIKDRLDILEVARSYITNFKRSGTNYFALCPFHQEKTPSFSINPELGIYKCFGCGESGDVFTLIEKMEGVEFSDALEIAAKRAGVKLERNYSEKDKHIHEERQEILKINALAAEYYNYILCKHGQGKKGRKYARERKITKKLIDEFKIGYAPRAYTNLLKFLKTKGYTQQNLIKWGLVVSGSGRVYDKFRSRLIFPLINHRGDIAGFSGRTILKNTKAPKYLHSPQTLAFDKGKFLFGLEQSKSAIRKSNFVVFCEGQLDVISSHKTDVKNIVASLGTSLTDDQLTLAKRYTKNIYFCFDNDSAGESALIRAANMAHKLDFNVKAVNIPEGKDADELINTNKAEWIRTVKKAEPIVDHMMRRLYRRLDLSKLEDKEEFSKIILPLIATIPQKIEQAHYLHRVSLILNVDDNILAEELESIQRSSDIVPKVNTEKIKAVLKSPVSVKEEYLLALILQHLQFLEASLKNINQTCFSSPLAREVFSKLKRYCAEKKRFSLKNFTSGLEEHEVSFVQNLLLKNLDKYFEVESEILAEIEGITKILTKSFLQNEIKKMKAQIEQAEITEDKAEVRNLIKRLLEVTEKIGSS
ncbi:DNA primase [Candidatus Dojkabacteria bacterium]|nr:DNA primase [Candidatus Dojkabacteria bacterium]